MVSDSSNPDRPTPDLRIPQRRCVGCRQLAPRDTLIRIVRQHDTGDCIICPNDSKIMGRSAYLCYNSDCLQRIRKKNRLRHALRAPVSPDLYDSLADLVTGDR